MKQLIKVMLAVMLFLSLCISANAAESNIVASGFCGTAGDEESIFWELDSDGLLNITGTGPMKSENNYFYRPPWNEYTEQIKTVVVSPGVTEIGDYAFYGCSNLTDVTLNEGLLKIRPCAFLGCKSLAEIDLPNSITDIGINVFTECLFTQITLPKNLEVLQLEAFWKCNSLKTIYISENIKSIGRTVFYNSPLTDVYYAGSVAQWNAITMHPWNGNLTHATIHCSDGIAAEGNNVGGNADAFPRTIELTLLQNPIDIPKTGEAPITIQPTVEIKDQYGQPHTPTQLTWSFYENQDVDAEGVQSLNGVTIDPDTGLITVSADALDSTFYVRVYAYTFIRDEESGNGQGSGSGAWTKLQIGAGGKISGTATLNGASIKLPTQVVNIPAVGNPAITLQPSLSLTDQNNDPYTGGYTAHWSLCTEIWGDDVHLLNGVSIDTDTGLITIPSDAQAGNMYVHVWVLDEEGNGTNSFRSLTLNPAHIHSPAVAVEENRTDATYLQDGQYDEVVYCSTCGNEVSRTVRTIPARGPEIAGQQVTGNAVSGYTIKAYKDLNVMVAAYQGGKMVDVQFLQVAAVDDTSECSLKFFLPDMQYDTLKLIYLTALYQPIGAACTPEL